MLAARDQKTPPVPLYGRVKQYIRERVERGEWPQGTRLPSEQELVEALGVSRMTVHRALRELSAEGRVSRVQGVGTFVSAPAQMPVAELLEIRDIADDIEARGHQHRAELLKLEATKATLDLANMFDLRPGARIFHSIVVHYENDVPIQLEDRYINPEFAPEYLQQDFSIESTAKYLMNIRPASEMEHTVFAVSADAETAALLQVEVSEPCLLVQRRTWVDSTPATKSLFICPGSRFSLTTRRKLTP
ncbi:histidine utilization repressor [Burkholderia cenocepacia]|nr:histidine utilization repressor [Burkholderia cenocepacia]